MTSSVPLRLMGRGTKNGQDLSKCITFAHRIQRVILRPQKGNSILRNKGRKATICEKVKLLPRPELRIQFFITPQVEIRLEMPRALKGIPGEGPTGSRGGALAGGSGAPPSPKGKNTQKTTSKELK